MTLLNFADHVCAPYVKKGMDYFRKGRVSDLSIINNVWTANVQGNSDYQVVVAVEGKHVAHTSCSCPVFNFKDNCKHVVAVICSLNEMLFHNYERECKLSDESIALVNSLSAEDLRLFIMHEMGMDNFLITQLRDYAEAARDHEAVMAHIQTINAGYERASVDEIIHNGGIDSFAVKPANKLLDRARKEWKAGKSTSAIDILFAIVSKQPSFDCTDEDNGGYYHRMVSEAFTLLDEIYTNTDLDEYNQRRMEKRAWDGLWCEMFELDDYEIHWLDLMLRHGNVEGQREKLLTLLDEMMENSETKHQRRRIMDARGTVLAGKKLIARKCPLIVEMPESAEQAVKPLPIPKIKAVASKAPRAAAPVSEKKAAFAREKQLLIEQLEQAKQGGSANYPELQKMLIVLMQTNSDVFGIREMAARFYEETQDNFFYQSLKDTYMIAEWNQLIAQQSQKGRPQGIVRRMVG